MVGLAGEARALGVEPPIGASTPAVAAVGEEIVGTMERTVQTPGAYTLTYDDPTGATTTTGLPSFAGTYALNVWVDDYAYKDEATLRVAAETAKTTVHELGHQFLLGDYSGGHPPHLAWNNSDGCVMIYGAPLLPDGRDPNYSGAHGSGSGEFGAWDVAQIRGMSGAGGDWENGL